VEHQPVDIDHERDVPIGGMVLQGRTSLGGTRDNHAFIRKNADADCR
jgi:hypothetical protein